MEEENSNISEKFDDVVNTLTTFKKSITLQSQIRDLEKTVKKDMKAIKKEAGKKEKPRVLQVLLSLQTYQMIYVSL